MASASFKAAGVLPLRFTPDGSIECLLAWEDTEGTRRCKFFERPQGCLDGDDCEYLHLMGTKKQANELPMRRLNFFGGKRESYEALSQETAAREFSEETNALISPQEALALVTQDQTQCVRLYGLYDLYILWLPDCYGNHLVKAYACSDHQPPLASAHCLHWIPLKALLNVQESLELGFHVAHLAISHLLWSFCSRQTRVLKSFINYQTINRIPLLSFVQRHHGHYEY